MTLIDEREVYYEQEKKRKVFKTLVTTVIVLMVVAIILLLFVQIRKSNKLKLHIDGKDFSSTVNDVVLRDDSGKLVENNGKIYFSVRDLSNMLGRQYYNSEYKKMSEDKNKCQIKNENEYTSLVSGSSKIYKAIAPKQKNKIYSNNENNQEFESIPSVEYEYFEIGDNVIFVNDKIYADSDAVKLAFDVDVTYDSKKKSIDIQTLDYLENQYAKNIRQDFVSSSEYDYANKRLLKYGMCIVKDSDNNYGVGSYTDKSKIDSCVASCKYSSIQFDEAKSVLNVTTSNDSKPGVLYLDTDKQEITKSISTHFDEISVIDNEFKYFEVKSQGKYGIMKENGEMLLNTSFDQIGIEDALYTGIDNKYIVDTKYIPVKKDGYWGLYDLNGNELIKPQYAEFGCSLAQSGEGVTIIPNIKENTDAAVFLYNKEKGLYGVYNAKTGERIAVSLIEVFKKDEENGYYINHVISKDNPVIHTLNVYKDI